MAIHVIYRTIDTVTGEMYIGSKKNYKQGKYYGSPKLKRAQLIIKERPETLRVEILEQVENLAELHDREVEWQKKYNVVEDATYWNQCYAKKGFCSLGKKLSEEHRQSIAQGVKGRKHTAEARLNMSKAQKGIPTPEHAKVIIKHKVSKLWQSEEYKEMQSNSHKAYFVNNPDARKSVTERLHKRYSNPIARQKVGEERRKYFSCPIIKKKLAEAHRKYYILDTYTGVFYDRDEAAALLNISPNNVRRALSNPKKITRLKFV